jgi:hypothetical protein
MGKGGPGAVHKETRGRLCPPYEAVPSMMVVHFVHIMHVVGG